MAASRNASTANTNNGASTAPLRISFAKIKEPLEVPNLLALQTESFDWLLGNAAWKARVEAALESGQDVPTKSGLEEIFEEISPIEDFSGSMSLTFRDHRFEPPKNSIDECKERDFTYAAPLFVTAEFTNNETGEIKSQTVFMGDFPLMTNKGTFVINGTERVVVSQLVRSPGVYFDSSIDKTSDKDIFSAKIIPSRGAWLEMEIDKRDMVGVRIDRKRKQSVTVLLKALGWTTEQILEEFGEYESMRATLEKDHTQGQDDALLDIYRKLRPGEPPTREAAQTLLENLYFNPKRYDLAKVGRYKVNKKLGADAPLDAGVLTTDDVIATIKYLVKLHAGETETVGETGTSIVVETDDIDHFGNRRLRNVGELIQNQVRTGLARMERVVRERMTTQDVEAITPQTLINIRPVVASIKEFFGTSQLSQFMDQTNPLSGLTHKRRLSALGPGGLSRERAGFEVRDVHPSHYGRMCPIETPEGPNIGLIGSLASYGRVNAFGFVETPVPQGRRRPRHRRGRLPHRRRGGPLRHRPGQRAADRGHALRREPRPGPPPWRRGRLRPRRRGRLHGRLAAPDGVGRDRHDPVPRARRRQPRAHGLEHDASGRAADQGGGPAGRHRHGVPLRGRRRRRHQGREGRCGPGGLRGLHHRRQRRRHVHHVPRRQVLPLQPGHLVQPEGRRRRGRPGHRAARSSPTVRATENGEMALGKNLLVAFMPWEGHNYEDAIILSQRLVQDDVLSSIHIEEHEVDARDTKLGPEEITRDIPNVSEEVLADLDERGIIRIGAEVVAGDILVGKVTPKGETELTPEERLLRAIFGEKAREVRDTSLKVPHGEIGKVIGVRVFDREEGDELPPGVNQLVRVYVAQKRKITDGDKLAGRHGNKGVISKILPVEDMPFLEDGTPVDIILNPLGVPSRMNPGQVLEIHLGWLASRGWEVAGLAEEWTQRLPGDRRRRGRARHQRRDPGLRRCARGRDRRSASARRSRTATASAWSQPSGKARLFDGRSGEPFPDPISVGYMYILKLHHLVDDKLHARSTGPYSMITQQPLGGKAQFGGQRFGEMEVWALEAYGAAYALQELLTIKSDDVTGRVKVYEAIVKGENIPEPGIPESFKVLIKEMQSLCLNVEVLSSDGMSIEMRDTDEDVFRAAEELGIDLSRREPSSVEEV